MIDELIHPGKLLGLLKNKYGGFVLQKSINHLTQQERADRRKMLESKINVTSQKERARVNSFLELLY
jgi:hypothetical protein